MPVLELNHIRKRFGDLEVLQDISCLLYTSDAADE